MSGKLRKCQTFYLQRRILNVVCVLFVFAYIAFDFLDLDLSEFPLKPTHQRAEAAVVEVPKEVKFLDAFAFGATRTFFPPIQNGTLEQLVHSFQTTTMQVFPHRDPRIVFHRVIFSPQSKSDSSPAA